ncbi:MAG: class I SAM-dependent methyltransferase [Deltaproteobacteria bacterium]|nr:class I SAM-dependent methyltransferase [Deltaproteobacteria bacterium]
MGLYGKYILPKITEFLCSGKPIMYQRKKVVPLAKGRVLEIGIGSGLNLQFYDSSKVEYLWGLDPSAQMRKMAEKQVTDIQFEVELIGLSGNEIPLASNSVNTVLVTYTLCTIPDVVQALSEMGRVLMPEGELIFCEHGLAPDEDVRRWQNRMNPIWKRMGGGCNLNKPIPNLIEQGGFKINNIETMYIPGWKPASFTYWGSAVRRECG